MIRIAALLFCLALASVCLAARTPASAPAPAGAQSASGKETLQRKCFQCHAASMWTSLRHDRQGWEGVLYRMVGRGALWTEAEIRAMADFLAEMRGPMP